MHGSAICFVPAGVDPETYLKASLARYSEHREVPMYDKECWCIEHRGLDHAVAMAAATGEKVRHMRRVEEIRAEGRAIEREAIEVGRTVDPDLDSFVAFATVGNVAQAVIDELERGYLKAIRREFVPFPYSRYAPGFRALEQDRRLKSKALKPSAVLVVTDERPEIPRRLEELVVADEAHSLRWWSELDAWEAQWKGWEKMSPDYGKPDPECETCKGSGVEKSTTNPEGHWDYWMIGGRMTAWFAYDGYDPQEDPRNWESCWICKGTGIRKDKVAEDKRLIDPTFECNGCSHDPGPPGTTLKSVSEWVEIGNTMPVSGWLELLESDDDFTARSVTPGVVVTRGGDWFEREPRYRATDEDRARWRERVKTLAQEDRHATAVAVDYHW